MSKSEDRPQVITKMHVDAVAWSQRQMVICDLLFKAREIVRTKLNPDSPADHHDLFKAINDALYVVRGSPAQDEILQDIAASYERTIKCLKFIVDRNVIYVGEQVCIDFASHEEAIDAFGDAREALATLERKPS